MSPKETKEAKAIRYLTTGHVVVRFHDPRVLTEVHVTSDSGGDPYHVTQRHGEWSCDCPASVECSHIIACRAIIPTGEAKLPEAGPDIFDALLDG